MNIYPIFNPSKIKKKSYKSDIMQLLIAAATVFDFDFFSPMKTLKPSSKVAIFFSLLPTGPKLAQISYSVP